MEKQTKTLQFVLTILVCSLIRGTCIWLQEKQSISLEPGGQFELSGAPLETLHQTCAEVNSHLYQVMRTASLY